MLAAGLPSQISKGDAAIEPCQRGERADPGQTGINGQGFGVEQRPTQSEQFKQGRLARS
jgi:hypothetical protein